MSEFTSPSFVSAYQAQAAKAAREAAAVQALAACLPRTSVAPVDAVHFGYCADMGLKFDLTGQSDDSRKATVAELFAAYTPLPLVDLPLVRTQKPVEYLRDQELTAFRREIFPAVVKYEKLPETALRSTQPVTHVRWWTRLAVGVVEVAIKGAQGQDLPVPGHAYAADSHTYSTGSQSMFHRRLKEYPLVLPKGLDEWFAPLEAFRQRLRSPGAVLVFNAAVERMLKDVPPGTTVGMLMGTGLLDYNPFRNLNPARYLTEAEATELVALLAQAKDAHGQMLATQGPRLQALVNEGADLVRKALEGFQHANHEQSVRQVLQQKLSRDLGMGVTLAQFRCNRRPDQFEVRVQLQAGRPMKTFFKDVTVPYAEGGAAVTMDDLGPEYVEI